MIEFTKCNDSIYLRLPLEDLFTPTSEDIMYEVCDGEIIIHDSMPLSGGVSFEFSYLNAEGCDSLVNVSLELRDVPQPIFTKVNPCN